MTCTSDRSINIATAAYWKNGVRTDLQKPYSDMPSVAYQIIVEGGSSFIAGYVTTDKGIILPVYWKDERIVYLEMPPNARQALAYNITVSGGDIYATGVALYDDFYPVIWKNGRAQLLPLIYEFRGMNYSYPISINNGDIYVFGALHHIQSQDWDTNPIPGYWKNGNLITLYPPKEGERGLAWSGLINNGVTYLAGLYFEDFLYTPVLWVGDKRQRLPMIDKALYGMARDVFIESNSVYVAGVNYVEDPINPDYVLPKPCYWKDGSRTDLPTLSAGAAFTYAIHVAK
jgi:hypothetical protein